jgi:hypothetical protein
VLEWVACGVQYFVVGLLRFSLFGRVSRIYPGFPGSLFDMNHFSLVFAYLLAILLSGENVKRFRCCWCLLFDLSQSVQMATSFKINVANLEDTM